MMSVECLIKNSQKVSFYFGIFVFFDRIGQTFSFFFSFSNNLQFCNNNKKNFLLKRRKLNKCMQIGLFQGNFFLLLLDV